MLRAAFRTTGSKSLNPNAKPAPCSGVLLHYNGNKLSISENQDISQKTIRKSEYQMEKTFASFIIFPDTLMP